MAHYHFELDKVVARAVGLQLIEGLILCYLVDFSGINPLPQEAVARDINKLARAIILGVCTSSFVFIYIINSNYFWKSSARKPRFLIQLMNMLPECWHNKNLFGLNYIKIA